MTPALDTKHLRLLVTLDEVGTLTGAARRLNLTASALSQQLRELEQRLGGALFRRRHGRLGVTAAGRLLTDAARAILGALTSAEAGARDLLGGATAVIRVGTASYHSYPFFPALLRSFAEASPTVTVTLMPEALANPCAWVAERRLDVAIVAAVDSHDKRVRLTPLFDDELVAVVGRGHSWFGARAVDPSAFASEHLWLDAAALAKDAPLGRALANAGKISPRRLTLMPSGADVPLAMARANLGVTVLPRLAAAGVADPGSLRMVRIGDGVTVRWSAVTRSEEPEPAVAAFVALLQHHPAVRAEGVDATAPRRSPRRGSGGAGPRAPRAALPGSSVRSRESARR